VNIPAPIQNVIEKTKALEAEIKTVGKDSMKELFVEFFKQFPDVKALRWTQYTPHFNDGEPCVFNVNVDDIEVQLNEGVLIAKAGSKHWVEKDEVADGEEFVGTWGLYSQPEIADSVGKIGGVFGTIESAMDAVFGDGVQVTVSSNGEIDVEDYDHD
jgi:hypothetical protein